MLNIQATVTSKVFRTNVGMSGMKIIFLLVQTMNFEGVEIIRFPDVE